MSTGNGVNGLANGSGHEDDEAGRGVLRRLLEALLWDGEAEGAVLGEADVRAIHLATAVESVLVRGGQGLEPVSAAVSDELWVAADARELELLVAQLIALVTQHGRTHVMIDGRAMGDGTVEVIISDPGEVVDEVGPEPVVDERLRGDVPGVGLRLAAALSRRSGAGFRAVATPGGGVRFTVSLRAATAPVRGMLAPDLSADPGGDPAADALRVELDAWMLDDVSVVQQPLDPATAADLLWVGVAEPVVLDVKRRIAAGDALARIVDELLAPILVIIGDRWESGLWSIADQKSASALLGHVVSRLELRERRLAQDGPLLTVVGGVDERHDLPSRLFALTLLEQGFRVRWLGADVPVADLGRDLRTHPTDAVLVFCHYPPLLGRVTDTIAMAASAGTGVILGGQAVASHPVVAQHAGADAAVSSLEELVPAVATLRPRRREGQPLRWDAVYRPVRAALEPSLPDILANEMTVDELRWLAEAISVARWCPTPEGAAVLDAEVAITQQVLRERLSDAPQIDLLPAICHDLAAAASVVLPSGR